MHLPRRLVSAAIAICVVTWAGVASATTVDVTPQGPNHTFDTGFGTPTYSEFSVNVAFDKTAVVTLYAGYDYDYTLYVNGPCLVGPGGWCYVETNPFTSSSFDVLTAGAQPPIFNTPYSQVTWKPTEEGFTLNFYAPTKCVPVTGDGVCHELNSLKMLRLAGTTVTNEPFQFVATFGEAAPRAVPEPATWAMMITGFGMVGFAMRRRRLVAELR
jgi:hypothetical protein